MPGNPVKIGPFLGGLNNMSTAGEAKDNELTELVNMEVAKDQSLTMRPPITSYKETAKRWESAPLWDILGVYRVTDTDWYLIVNEPTSATLCDVRAYQYGDFTTTPLIIRSGFGEANRVTSMAQFKNELFFITGPNSNVVCFKWSFGTTFTLISTMPKGTTIISWKSRLWVTGTNNSTTGDRIWFSKVGAQGPEPGVWETNDFFDVAPGEGGLITAIIPSFNNLIVFKSDGTWRFTFPSSPKQGSIDKISGQVGASGPNSVIEFENYIYVYDQGSIYELVNSNYAQLNTFIRFEEDPDSVDGIAPGIDLSILNRRLIVRYFNAIYVFSIDTKAWSQWRTTNGTPGRFFEMPVDSNRSNASVYLAASRGKSQNPSVNLIKDQSAKGTTSITAGASAVTQYFEGDENGGRVSIAHNYAMVMTCNVISNTASSAGFRIETETAEGATGSSGTTSYLFTGTGPQTIDLVRYANSISIKPGVFAIGGTLVVEDVQIKRAGLASPTTIMKISDETHRDTPLTIEYIEASMLTKTYDYQAAASFKRLFYWGADLVTPRPIHAEARPVGKKNSLTWADLEVYTHEELEQGTWENPLSWKLRSTAEVSMTDDNIDISENGRFYVKLRKNLRFRQIAFFLRFTSKGNLETGPAKVFAITTLVSPKKDTIDTAT